MREAPGSVFQASSGTWCVRVSLPGGKRKAVSFPWAKSEDDAQARGSLIANLVRRLRAVNQDDVLLNVVQAAGRAGDDTELALILTAVAQLESKPQVRRVKPLDVPTFIEFAELWKKGKLHEQWPDHIRVAKKAHEVLGNLQKHMPDWFKEKPIAEITLDDCDKALASLSRELQGSTRRQLALNIHHMMAMATYPAKLLAVNPIPRGWLPKTGASKALSFLYPSEDLQLMKCVEVPLVNRILYGFLAREGLRREEAIELRVSDLDLIRGTIRLDENKTDDPRIWTLDPGVKRGLETFVRLAKLKPTAKLFKIQTVPNQAGRFRDCLVAAGIKRPELFESSKVRRPIRIHDLRATFVTLALADGRSETWVCDRTGHRSSSMVHRYKRLARTATELHLGWLAPLDESIPELRQAGNIDGASGGKPGPNTTGQNTERFDGTANLSANDFG